MNQEIEKDSRELDLNTKERMQEEIDNKLEGIIEQLHLERSTDPIEQLKTCGIIQKYIALNNNTDLPSLAVEREEFNIEDLEILDLYQGLIENVGSNTSDVAVFESLAKKVGIEARTAFLHDKNTGDFRMSNIVKLGDVYYICDSTLERALYEEYKDTNEFHLCALALGEEYFEYYEPIGLKPKNLNGYPDAMPFSIAKKRIPPKAVDSLVKEEEKSRAR